MAYEVYKQGDPHLMHKSERREWLTYREKSSGMPKSHQYMDDEFRFRAIQKREQELQYAEEKRAKQEQENHLYEEKRRKAKEENWGSP